MGLRRTHCIRLANLALNLNEHLPVAELLQIGVLHDAAALEVANVPHFELLAVEVVGGGCSGSLHAQDDSEQEHRSLNFL